MAWRPDRLLALTYARLKAALAELGVVMHCYGRKISIIYCGPSMRAASTADMNRCGS